MGTNQKYRCEGCGYVRKITGGDGNGYRKPHGCTICGDVTPHTCVDEQNRHAT